MKIYRGLLVLIEMVIFAVGALFIGCILFPVMSLFLDEKNRRKKFASLIHNSWKLFTAIMEKTRVIKVRVDGDLSQIRGKIVAASHPSLIDIVLLIGLMPDSLCLAKKELLKNPVMRNIVKSLYIINGVDPEIFKKSAVEALNDGYNIIIFPTGTRTLPNQEIKIRKGASQIAIASGVDIVPVKIEAEYPFLIKNHFPLDAGEKTVNYKLSVLPEIKISEFDTENLSEIKLRNQICDCIKERIN